LKVIPFDLSRREVPNQTKLKGREGKKGEEMINQVRIFGDIGSEGDRDHPKAMKLMMIHWNMVGKGREGKGREGKGREKDERKKKKKQKRKEGKGEREGEREEREEREERDKEHVFCCRVDWFL